MSSTPTSTSTVTRLEAYRRRRVVRPMDRTFDDVIGRAPIGFLHLDAALRCMHINPWLAAAYGVAAEDALGRPLHQILPALVSEVDHDFVRLLGGGTAVRLILKVERAGEKTYYQHHFAPVIVQGEARGVDVFVCNVDGPMRAQTQLRLPDGRSREGAKRMPSRRNVTETKTPAA